jgi:tetratricopeptide (TPR) repeat protein
MENRAEGFLKNRRLHILLIILLGLLVYSNTFAAPFEFDDIMFVDYRNIMTQANKAASTLQIGKAPAERISLPAETLMGPWSSRPLLYATFVANELMGGFNTWGYHIFNIAMHIGNGILLYFLIVMTGRHSRYDESDTVPVAVLSSLIFVLHPVHTETVTMVVNRSMLMATTFYLAGLMLFLKIVTSEGKAKNYYTIGLLLAAVLGASSREDFATFPLMLFIYDLLFISRFRLRDVVGHLKSYLACLPGLAFMGFLIITNTYDKISAFSELTLPEFYQMQPLDYALTQFKIQWTYIRLLLLPINQNLDYTYPISKTLFDIPTMLSMAGYAGLWAAGLLLAKKRPAASIGILWFLVILIPISFGVALLGLRLGDPIFEHRLYLPSIGLTVLAAIGLARLVRARRAVIPVVAALCLVLGATAYARNDVWTSDGKLWNDAVLKSPNSPRAHNNIASFLSNHGLYDEAIEHFEKAIELWPDNYQFYSNLGHTYLIKGDIDNAVEPLETSLEIEPSAVLAHESLGAVYMKQEQYEKALEHFLAESKLQPWDPGPLNDAARASYAMGRTDEAIEHYNSSLWLNRKQVRVLNNLIVLLMETGKNEQAIKRLESLVNIIPEHVTARVTLGKLYLEEGKSFDAVIHLKKAAELRPENPEIHHLLAEAYREIGNAQAAEEQLRMAEDLEESSGSKGPKE